MSAVRRLHDQEIPRALGLLAGSGGTVRQRDSWDHDRMTALVLAEGETVEVLMPLARRTIRAAPGRALEAGWLSSNQFASRMSWRRQTRESESQWGALLPEVDALLVMRREEQALLSAGGGGAARWYRQTGFAEVLSIRCLYLEMEEGSWAAGGRFAPAGRYHMQVVDPADNSWDAVRWQREMAAVYADVYGACGGAAARGEHFWEGTLAHHFYREHYQFQILGLWSAPPAAEHASLAGYAVVGWSGWHSKRPRMDILELATRQWDSAAAGELIAATCQLAQSKSVRQVRAVISAHDPYRGHLARMQFVDRWGYAMLAKWLHAQRYLDRLGETLPAELGDFWIQLNSPGELPLTLGRGARSAPANHISLHSDAATRARLVLNRIDLPGALADGTLAAAAALSDGDVARLSLCFPWTPWVFHMVDYI